MQDLVDEGRLARPRNARDGDELPQRKRDVDVAQVVLACAPEGQELAGSGPPRLGYGDLPPSRQVLPGERPLLLEERFDRSRVHHRTAVLSRPGSDVDHVVGVANGLLVVLDDDHRVADVAEPQQRLDEPAVVALVEPDRRFVQHVEHPDEAAADLGGQPDPLCLAAGQRRRRAGERQVVETDVEQEPKAGVDLLEDRLGDHGVAVAELETGQDLGSLANRELADVVDRMAVHVHGQREWAKACAAAVRAGHLAHVALDLLPAAVALAVLVASPQIRHDTLEVGRVDTGPAETVAVPDLHPMVNAALQEQFLVLLRQ